MVACLILAFVAVAGAAYLAHGKAAVVHQKNRRTALEFANSRLETLTGMPYDALKNLTPGSIQETFNLNGKLLPMESVFVYSTVVTNAIEVSVSVAYRGDLPDDRVSLTTLIAPK
jgi:hypothetical protein